MLASCEIDFLYFALEKAIEQKYKYVGGLNYNCCDFYIFNEKEQVILFDFLKNNTFIKKYYGNILNIVNENNILIPQLSIFKDTETFEEPKLFIADKFNKNSIYSIKSFNQDFKNIKIIIKLESNILNAFIKNILNNRVYNDFLKTNELLKKQENLLKSINSYNKDIY